MPGNARAKAALISRGPTWTTKSVSSLLFLVDLGIAVSLAGLIVTILMFVAGSI